MIRLDGLGSQPQGYGLLVNVTSQPCVREGWFHLGIHLGPIGRIVDFDPDQPGQVRVYEGPISDWQPHGSQGRCSVGSIMDYEGEWVKGVKQGLGKMTV